MGDKFTQVNRVTMVAHNSLRCSIVYATRFYENGCFTFDALKLCATIFLDGARTSSGTAFVAVHA